MPQIFRSDAIFGKDGLKTLESLDSSFPSLSAVTIKELAELGFIDRAYNILFVGPAGTDRQEPPEHRPGTKSL
jgi:hypothetical protein